MNLFAAKIYYDGSHWIAIPHTERPYRQRRGGNSPKRARNCSSSRSALKRSKAGEKAVKQNYCHEFTPMFKDEDEAEQFVEEHFNRLSRNRWNGISA